MNQTKDVGAVEKVEVVPPSPAEREQAEKLAQQQEVVEEAGAPQQQAETTETTETQTPVVPATNPDVDEFGVPWRNRAAEWQRKSEQLTEKLPQIIEEQLRKVVQPQQPTYTYEQLEAYKLENSSNPNAVAWATGQQRELQKTEQRKMFEDIVGQRDKVREAEVARQQSFDYVQKTYPEAMDVNHPIAQGIKSLMQNPELANNPWGLSAAADIAYGRYMRSQAGNIQQTNSQLKREVKTLQKNSLTEGAGRKVVTTPSPQQTAMERVRKTGSIRDAESAVGAILRQKGILPEE